ncbi:unnamed protein product [Phaedon cochleariae]|uniref:T-complex-associated testis-expressed protein 1 n=1 Tax=Phaedon cochleariae TaxID=80249 RepID=A0A9P0DWQ6_PHACE|nr:unnamed protein product [Phaedon cochleariae]
MRIPHSINPSTLVEYSPSPESLDLVGEDQRKIISENFDWNKDHCPTLIHFCLKAIAKNFEKKPIFDELPCEDKDQLLEIIPTDLPLEQAIPFIHDEYYWKRRYEAHFKTITRRKPKSWTWKNLYLERHLQKLVEEAQPQYSDEENMGDILDLCSPYVSRLIVTQLQLWQPPLNMDKEDYPEIFPVDHINFLYILRKLCTVTEFDLVFGMNDVSEKFDWNMFKVTVLDCQRLGKALLELKNLEILRIHRSRLGNEHCQALMQNLIKNKSLLELDLSNCEIGDQGALCVAKFLAGHPSLKILNLANNRIGKIGAEGLGFTLLLPSCAQIHTLVLKLNPLGKDGAMGIMRGIVRCSIPLELSMAGCDLEGDTPVKIGQMIRINDTLEKLDLSNNWFGADGGTYVVEALNENYTLQWLDMRETDITSNQQQTIKSYLFRNRRLKAQEDKSTSRSCMNEESFVTDIIYRKSEQKPYILSAFDE